MDGQHLKWPQVLGLAGNGGWCHDCWGYPIKGRQLALKGVPSRNYRKIQKPQPIKDLPLPEAA
jgi:hypothetical protein